MPKKSVSSFISHFTALGLQQQADLLKSLDRVHEDAKLKRAAELIKELAFVRQKRTKGVKKTRAKPAPKYRSKKNRKLVWTGRGSLPRWLREEIKATKQKADAFLVRRPT